MDSLQEIARVCSPKRASNVPALLKKYARDESFFHGAIPALVIWPSKLAEVQRIVSLAKQAGAALVPVSSKPGERVHGDTIPRQAGSIIVDLARMDRIERIDRPHRVVAIEPGVTFDDLVPALRKQGLRLNMPLFPRSGKSVVASALEREPVTMPRYQWDSSDPLLCTEVVFGTGDVFRTGSAAGPGTIKEQRKAGQAQVNPMGPTQFNPMQVIQGAQGTLGIVTWATIKCEILPTIQHVHIITSSLSSLPDLLAIQHELVKNRLCDEIFIMNQLAMASLLENKVETIQAMRDTLPPWNLIFITSGHGVIADEEILYRDEDIRPILDARSGSVEDRSGSFSDQLVLDTLAGSCERQWRSRYKGAHEAIFFTASPSTVSTFANLADKMFHDHDLLVYLQLGNLGSSCHCEFDISYDPGDAGEIEKIQATLQDWYLHLIEAGAFFSRPYGDVAKLVFQHYRQENIDVLRKVKAIFDPENVLNPGALCFGPSNGGVEKP